ncbi:MAG: redoxin domain-containing protein [Fuerstiella sp.]
MRIPLLLSLLLAGCHSNIALCAQTLNSSSHTKAVGNFALNDFRGKRHELYDFKQAKVVVLAFLGTECPLVKLYARRLQELSETYGSRGVVFVGVNSNRQDSITDIGAFARLNSLTFPILKDVGNKLADEVAADRTPSVVVLDGDRVVRYSGRIDDQYGAGYARDTAANNYLQDAMESLLSDKPVSVASMPAEGCLIGRLRKVDNESLVTFGQHIAPILNKHCVECHRDGEIAPFSLTSFDEVAGWAEMIREVIQDRRMPPWHADPAHGHFANNRGLSDKEKQLVNDWVLAGAPAGDLSSLPALPPKATGWQLESEPDLVVAMQSPFSVPAEGTVRYKFFEVDPGFKEDKWMKAAEVVPGSRDVVHHVLVFVKTGSRLSRGGDGSGGEFLAAYVPGLRAAEYPQGMAKLIPAGSTLIFQMHYTPVGVSRQDQTSIGLYFANDKDVKEVVMTQKAATRSLEIPPNDPDYHVDASSPRAPTELKVLALMPHMHLRGKSFRYEAVMPGGHRKTLLDVPDYDFNWQTSYLFAEPITFPVGARMYCEASFDNSDRNLNNPDPSATVTWGDQTWDEMMIGYFDVAIPRNVLAGKTGGKAENERSETMNRFDADGDGKIQKSEVPQRLHAIFEKLDSNADGHVDEVELKKLPGGR